MITGSICDCLVCRLEASLIAELGEGGASSECTLLAASSSALSCFPSPLDLVRKLHTHEDGKHNSTADALLSELLKQSASAGFRSVCQRLLLLVFIPTIHRTASHVRAAFPSIARDDASQHIVCAFLEFLDSEELQTHGSHVAFFIARKLRRHAFRWAIQESRGAVPEEVGGDQITEVEDVVGEEPLYAEVLLKQFLDNCQKMGWLSLEERTLLVRFKIEGLTCEELAGRNGHAAAAVQHRIQRLLERLRRLAHQTRWQRAPEQLELFPR
jgi:DNA-directed RNA polymerase specialized sigma24 family protein